MEVAYRKNWGAKVPKPSKNLLDVYDLKRLRDPSKMLVVLDNKVINLKGFAKYHPGGKFLIEKNYGTDVSRYFYGVYGYNKAFKAYTHSLYNWKMLEKRVVGHLQENYDLFEIMFDQVPEKQERWHIAACQGLTSLISRV